MEKAVARVAKIKVGDPLDPTTQMGAQCSKGQLDKILNYIEIGKQEGAKCMTGGERAHLGGALENGFYVKPTVFVGHNKMRIFQEEIFGPVLSVTKFKTMEEAIEIANDTIYGLGAGVWSRDGATAYLTHVHIADSFDHRASSGLRYIVNPPGSTARVHQHLDIGQGDVDWDVFFRTLTEVGFDGIACVCVFAWEERARESSTYNLEQIRQYLAKHGGLERVP